jgi:hypothetical protein
MTFDTADETAVITNFRAAQEHQLSSIRKIADGLVAFVALSHWFDSVARAYNGSSNGEANWRAFIRRYLPAKYHPDREVRRLYDGLRGALSHELGTRGVYPTDDPNAEHWADVGDDHRLVHLATFIEDCAAALTTFMRDVDHDAALRSVVANRTRGVVRPVQVVSAGGVVSSTASATTIGVIPLDWPRPES